MLLRRDTLAGLLESWRSLRAERYDFAVDFQGLIKSALAASAARPDRIFGFHHTQLRERAAALFYSHKTVSGAAHVVDKNLDLAAAAGAATLLRTFPLPPGRPEGALPPGDFVLASPLAGWRAKQWPIEHYQALAARLERELGIPLVLDGPPGSGLAHCSGLPGLIHATRRAAAVVGVDSGPLHLAAALGKPGVADLWPHRPRAQRPLWRFAPGPAQSRRRHHLQARRVHRRSHARRLPRPGVRGPQGDARRAPEPAVMPAFPKRYADAVAKLRVPAGFVLVLVFAWFSRPTSHSLALGLPFGLLGLALRAWAAGCLAKNQQLATGGPYAYTRNPLYLGTLLVAAGLVIASRNIGLGILFIAVFSAGLSAGDPTGRAAPAELCFRSTPPMPARYPLSGPVSHRPPQKTRILFRTALYLRNQEYQAGAGFVAGMLFLLWKVLG